MTDTIKFLKTRVVKDPSRANAHDAGIDFYVPEFTPEFVEVLKEKNPEIYIEPDKVVLGPNERVLIPSGIYCQMAKSGRALIAHNKSGVATKFGLVYGAQVVDYEYQGEIHLSLIYTGNGSCEILPGQKILQFLEIPIFTSEIEIFGNLIPASFYERETTRGPDGFGSTDKT